MRGGRSDPPAEGRNERRRHVARLATLQRPLQEGDVVEPCAMATVAR
jgi:hypothetical protein